MAADSSVFDASGTTFTVTKEMVQAYQDQGYVLIRGLLSEREASHLKCALDSPDGVLKHAYGRSDGNREAKLCLWQHPGSDVTGTFVRTNKIAGTAEKLMGGDEVYHYHSKLMMKEARTGGAFLWHQDYGYWHYNSCLLPEMCSVFVPIDDCMEVNGCLQVIPGSHKMGRLDHVTQGEQLTVEPNRLKMVMERYPARSVEMMPGDVLFFHCNLLHCSSQNNSDKRRHVLITAFNKRLNDPVKEHHHPRYTPLVKLPDTAFLECKEMENLTGKDFLKPGDESSHKGSASAVH